jgi:hypothetical protein
MKKAISTRSFTYDKGLRMNKHTILHVEKHDFGMTAYRLGSSVGMNMKKGDLIMLEDTSILTDYKAQRTLSDAIAGAYPTETVRGYYSKRSGFTAFYGNSFDLEIEDFKYEGDAVAFALELDHVHQPI